MLKKINKLFLVVNIVVSLYILFAPFYGDAEFYFKSKQAVAANAEQQKDPLFTKQNSIKIESLNLQSIIYEGDTSEVLQKGIWRRPNTSTPTNGGNTVFVAHRFLYSTGSGVFYNLPKIKKDAIISVKWQGKSYRYKVLQTKVVEPTDTSVEQQTQSETLTLYTCTPLWTSAKRFVVKAVKI